MVFTRTFYDSICPVLKAMIQEIPLIEYIYKDFKDVDLKKVTIITCQHILLSNFITFQYLFKLGLEPQNVFILGKSYSSNSEIASYMKNVGMQVHSNSFHFDSHKDWDSQFNFYVSKFIEDTLSSINKADNKELIILIDDGGHLIEQLNSMEVKQKIVCIEWTSSGYNNLSKTKVNYPVINVARSKAKLLMESPVIGLDVVRKIIQKYPYVINSDGRALIVGSGFIGTSIKNSLEKNNKQVSIIDLETPLNSLNLKQFDLIIGCTGEKSFSADFLNSLGKTVLVSASSSDREFPASLIRKNFYLTNDTHKDYLYKEITLSNSGFPINFDGEQRFTSLENIQITLALIFVSVCLAKTKNFEPGFNEFPVDIGDKLMEEYKRLT